MNGWSLALGLTPDPTANVVWTDQFHSDLQDVVHLARVGRADWSLIYNFLRCYNFVLGGEVPPERRFSQTTALLKETDVGEVQENIISIEDVQSADSNTKTLDLSQLRHANRIALLPGRRHDLSAAFPSDKWGSDARADANDLARNGKLDLNANEAQLRKAHADLRNGPGPVLREELQTADANYKRQARDELLKTCQDHLTRWHTGIDLLFHERSCAVLHDTLNFYRYVFQEDFLGNVLHNEAFPPGDWNKQREASEINLAVSAVVAAIDDLQLQKHQTNVPGVPFAGGFSLSTSTDIAIGAGSSVSRPRRCWLMPLSIMEGGYLTRINQWRQENGKKIPKSNGGAQGHHILVVLQEEEEEEGQEEQNEESTKIGFGMYFYDSAPKNLKDTLVAEGVAGPLPVIVSDIAQGLQWFQHREGETKKYTISEVPTSRQPHGGWQCGPHVIINAWILALGLRPDPSKKYDDIIYQELHVLARAAVVGLLDWRTLVAWIFCHKLALETSMDSVTPDRHFRTTSFWENENALVDRIRSLEHNDVLLGAMSQKEMPYDRGNNPVHAGAKTPKDAGDGKQKEGGEAYLARSYDDLDQEILNQPSCTTGRLRGGARTLCGVDEDCDVNMISSNKRKSREGAGSVRDILRDPHENGDVEVADAAHPTPSRKRRRLGDSLSFLDAY